MLFSLNAQTSQKSKFELTGGLGVAQIFGDIGGYSSGDNLLGLKDLTIKQSRFDISTGVRYRMRHNLAARVNVVFGYFHATDKRGSNVTRALECNTWFVEPSLLGEYYFLNRGDMPDYSTTKGKTGRFKSFLKALDPYVFAGFGGLSYNILPNRKLDQLSRDSKGITAVIPAGAGVNILFTQKLLLGLELGGRYSFSDHLEGYSSRYSKHNDVYYFLNMTAGLRF
jgi:hypothetical protein